MLNKLSQEVESAGNGAEAVASADKQRFDLVLMDCQLPDIDGYEAARLIRAGGASAGVPVMALSAITLAKDRRRCEEAGMEGRLAKLLSRAGLSEALAKFNK
jgi:CheY-like chemotaxis protein